MENKTNPSIQCTVDQCAYHAKNANYCSLNSIKVGTHEVDPTVPQCTECESFVRDCKDGKCGPENK